MFASFVFPPSVFEAVVNVVVVRLQFLFKLDVSEFKSFTNSMEYLFIFIRKFNFPKIFLFGVLCSFRQVSQTIAQAYRVLGEEDVCLFSPVGTELELVILQRTETYVSPGIGKCVDLHCVLREVLPMIYSYLSLDEERKLEPVLILATRYSENESELILKSLLWLEQKETKRKV